MPATEQIDKKKTYTYEDYERLPEGAPYQLIGGELIMTPAPIPYHQKILGKIFFEMNKFVEKNNLGDVYISPIDVYFSQTDVYQPDIIFISKDRLNIIGEKKIEGPPDLVIEILSPATAYYDLRIKKDVYEKSGVKEYWIVDPMQKTIEVFINKNGKFESLGNLKDVVKSSLIEGFNIEVREIFR
ncbi:MAG: Uma2 family endonuclease [Nitrospirae bacterium]|nr:Uma2 family endonuclease [Nitrospirota bacterium]